MIMITKNKTNLILSNATLGNINTVTIAPKNLPAPLAYKKGDYFGKRFKCTLSRNIYTNLFLKNFEIKNPLSKINLDSLLKNPQVRYASTDSQNNDTQIGSETVNPDKQAAENWEKVQSSTADYFRFMSVMGQILEHTNIEGLSTRSKELAKNSENSNFFSDEETIIDERNTINNQSQLISQSEDSLAERAKISNIQQQHYNNLQPSMKRLKDERDEAVKERKNLEESWQQLLENDTESEQTESEENLEIITEQAENEKNLETTTQQAEHSEGKRKLDVSEQERAESSKKQKTESESQEPRSLIDDFADLSQEPADYTGGDD